MEVKHFTLEEFKANDDTRTIEGYASVFNNVDNGNDIVLPGAFKKSINAKPSIPMLWQHDTHDVIGMWTDFEEREKGLFVKGTIIDTTLGVDAYKLAKAGAIKGMSIGYSTKKYEIDKDKGTRKLQELELHEVSLVTFPMNERAQVTAVKSKPANERELEEYLREGGYSQSEAKGLIAKGYKAIAGQREVERQMLSDDQLAALSAELSRILTA